ncbi:MAG TPA: tetratricopeptide repeat protein, partial [Bacteroidia bacterium]|nr:tetratricopeptide repeat protein [Bacteroidia bacterium]
MTPIQELESNLKSALTDPERMDLMLQLIQLVRNNDPVKAENYCNELLALAEKNENSFFRAGALRFLGTLAEQKTDYPKAIRYNLEAKTLYTELNLPSDIVSCNNQLGKTYANLGDYSKAIDFFDESLRLSSTIEDKASEAGTLNALSVLYQRSGNSEKAEELALKSIVLSEKSGNKRLWAISKINLGNAYGVRMEWDKAISVWEESIEIFRQLGEPQ